VVEGSIKGMFDLLESKAKPFAEIKGREIPKYLRITILGSIL
jgi:hypothetical protein